MKKLFIVIPLVVILSGCKTGQMGTILSASGYGGGVLLATGYKYMKNEQVSKEDVNDIATMANTMAIFGNIAGQSVDHYFFKKQLKKLRKRK